MSDKPLTDTGDRLAAVRDELHEMSGIVGGLTKLAEAERKVRDEDAKARERASEGPTRLTPPPVPVESTERMMRTIAVEVYDDRIKGHAFDCVSPTGPLGAMAAKVDGLSRKILLATGALLLVGALLPYLFGRMNTRLDKLDAMTSQLSALQVQVTTLLSQKGHTELEPLAADAPQIAQVLK